MDLQIYRILFPKISVFSKSSASEVKNLISGINESFEHHRCNAIGIVDGDAMIENDRVSLKARNIWPLNFYSVEYLYYCKEVFEWVVANHAYQHGINIADSSARYVTAVMTAMVGNRERLISRVCEQSARRVAMADLPTWQGIASRGVWEKSIDLNVLFVSAVPAPLGFHLRTGFVASSADIFAVVFAHNELTGDSRVSSL